MSSQEFLYYSLAIGFIVLVGFISFAMFHLAESLKSLKVLLENIDDTTKDFNLIKNKIKLGALTAIGAALAAFLKQRR
ncbi:hypothetical protein A2111_02505 [Candidatus Daviesbacteria bacterium GWA1_38_6]|nr:MAG: hypothetical protein A2111_02505 [Candidatus Daviesbacteria bacterium GWA1_38_6]